MFFDVQMNSDSKNDCWLSSIFSISQANGQIQFGAQREAEALKATDTVFTQVRL
jgi:hypothetical protein